MQLCKMHSCEDKGQHEGSDSMVWGEGVGRIWETHCEGLAWGVDLPRANVGP